MSWPKIKNITGLNYRLLLFYETTTNHFSIGLWCVTKSEFYTTKDNQFTGWTKKKLQSTSQTQTCKKKKLWSLFGSLLKVWPTMAFWIPAKPLHLRSMLSKLMRCTKNYKACNRDWSTKWPQFFSTTMRDQLFKSWMNQAMMLIHPPYSPDLSPEDYHFFKHLNNFMQGKCFHNQQEAEDAFQKFTESWSMDFYTIGMSNLISHWQKCADYSSSYFD